MAQNKTVITIRTTVNAPVEKVWEYWTKPEHITQWNYASDDWCCPRAENDVRPGGNFSCRMEAKDGSMGFDFGGVYGEVRPKEYIDSTLGDDRKVTTDFIDKGDVTEIVESFEAENTHPIEMQQSGWQNILNNFKAYTETH